MSSVSLATEVYIDRLGNDVHHARVFDFAHEFLRGFGSASSREVAMLKAYSEYCERASMLHFTKQGEQLNSNGFAVHRTPELAREASYSELIERDLVMSCWLAHRSPEWLKALPAEWSSFERLNIQAKVGRLGSINGTSAYASILLPRSNSNFGFIFSSAANVDQESALKSLYFTQRRNLTAALDYLDTCVGEFPAREAIKDPQSHRNYYLNRAHADTWRWLLLDGKALDDVSVSIRVQDVSIPFSTTWPLYAARAESRELQNYFVGPPRSQILNFSRLRFFGIESEFHVNNELHPLA